MGQHIAVLIFYTTLGAGSVRKDIISRGIHQGSQGDDVISIVVDDVFTIKVDGDTVNRKEIFYRGNCDVVE